VIDETPAIIDSPRAHVLTQPRGEIDITEAHFSYADGTKALRGVSLSAKAGQNEPYPKTI